MTFTYFLQKYTKSVYNINSIRYKNKLNTMCEIRRVN